MGSVGSVRARDRRAGGRAVTRTAATLRQIEAADPDRSTWLSANAGSGKTRVLIDRVARLLLGGCDPQRILCLTYTKAAATEMQNRLFGRLGEWTMMPEEKLSDTLADLGVDMPLAPDMLRRARRLFARAIETPGGLRIQTIHSFCAGLLRRFPLEAGVSPQFREMDDRTGRLLRDEVLDRMAGESPDGPIARLARQWTGEDLGALSAQIAARQGRFPPEPDPDTLWREFGLPPGLDEASLAAQVLRGEEAEWLPRIVARAAAGTAKDQAVADRLRRIDPAVVGGETLAALESCLLFKSGARAFEAKGAELLTKATWASLCDLHDPLLALMDRVEAARPARLAVQAARMTLVLHEFAAAFLPAYAEAKANRGLLDFDDLILRARLLLSDPSVAQWVLWRLDGGIDHILVDEAQDTSPDQWAVIERLAEEFTVGEGARPGQRTIFVVGDKKQSIYSFQGADLARFEAMEQHFAARLSEAGTPLRRLVLEHSFRSAQSVLRAVDLTFDDRRAQGLGADVRHIAFHDSTPGRVDLWPLVDPSPPADDGHWADPVDLPAPRSAEARLADAIADEIGRMISAGETITHRGTSRPVHAGDFLILVQRRSRLFHELIRACKARQLPVAGADRLRLQAEVAVRDLTALLSFLATPEDDLSLAAALRSPLFGLSEAQLFDLAAGRPGYLWEALRKRADHAETRAVLGDLLDQTDFLRPFELTDRVLTRHNRRQMVLARLGPEAEEGIDLFLAQALAYEEAGVPSLTGFLTWLGSDEVEAKRQPEAAGALLRVMTVHGAKGLEAPVVILPDTADRREPSAPPILDLPSGTPAWRPPAGSLPPVLEGAVQASREALAEENRRLLYVAMTRAECWLIVAGAGEVNEPKQGEKLRPAWHELVEAGLRAAGALPLSTPVGTGLRLENGTAGKAGAAARVIEPPTPSLPGWVTERPLPPLPDPVRLSPSDLGGAKALPGELAEDDDADPHLLDRGTLLHRLLELLPAADRGDWPGIAAALWPDPALVADCLAEAAAVLDDPACRSVLGPESLAEVAVAATLHGRQMSGTIDRIVIRPDSVLVVDFKSNRLVPDRPEEVPEGILRQMAAYRMALSQIWPDRRIQTAVLWTRRPALMPLPDAVLDAAMARVETSLGPA
ncbi:MAG: double-strand break repair helicase AddA [Gemmobacter sp.]